MSAKETHRERTKSLHLPSDERRLADSFNSHPSIESMREGSSAGKRAGRRSERPGADADPGPPVTLRRARLRD
jgi:hypothetical protein